MGTDNWDAQARLVAEGTLAGSRMPDLDGTAGQAAHKGLEGSVCCYNHSQSRCQEE